MIEIVSWNFLTKRLFQPQCVQARRVLLTDGFSEVRHPNGFLSQNLSQLIICRAASNLSFFRNLVLNRNDMNLK